MNALKWLLRIVFIRMLGRRAVPVLAVLGIVGAIRAARTRDVEAVDPQTGGVLLRGDRRWR